MIGCPACFPIVVVIADQVARYPVIAQNPGHGIVKGLERAPRAMKKIRSPGMEVAARRHAWHGTNVTVIKGDRSFRQSLEVGSMRPVAAVGGQHVPVQGIEHHHDCFHE